MDLSNLLRFPSQIFLDNEDPLPFPYSVITTNQNETVKKRSSLTQRWLLPINFPLKHKRFGKAAVTWCLRLAQFGGKYEKQFQRWSVSSGRTWEVVLNRLIEKLIVDCQWLGRSDNGLLNQFDLREDSDSSSEICFESQVFEAEARSPQLELDKWDEDWSCEVFLTKCRPW